MTDPTDIVERLSASARGYDEWRVQDDEGNYTIAFSWPEYVNPEREAQDWLAANQKYRAGYVVAKVHVLTLKEQRLLEAAAEITRLRAEVEALRTAMSCAADLIAESMMHDAQTGTLLAKAHNLLAGTQAIDATKGTT